ncbi:MAG: AAA family ATPase [Candidatus Omnitrophica bacterium]|nr:AAA family ATPase [Candidatus Omnitrophota bacterium]
MRSRRFKMYFKMYWPRIVIIFAIIFVVMLAVWGLMSLESFYRNITLATMPINLIMVALNATIFVFMYMMFMQGGLAKISKSKIKGELVNVKWDDVIGMEEAKREAWELVQLIKDRAKVKQVGGKILRGMLMLGPPGCGKTYLAKAIATETKIPFLSMSGSEFVEIFVGVGASRVRRLFKKARELSYGFGGCIIFIDELDAIARKRVFSVFGGTEETNSTQNQLLAEMDGLQEKDENVVVIGATNAGEDTLDRALLRPGRFDRKLHIDRPNLEEREKLFEFYFNKINYDKGSVDIKKLARKAVYKTPAEIENIVKEAALIAARDNKPAIEYKHVSEAIERIEMGLKHRRNMTPREKEMTAWHETGHLIVLYLLHPTKDVFKASIIGRRGALGVVHENPREEWFTRSREVLVADIKTSLAGFVAEKLRFNTTSDGVDTDFKQAMSIAHNMVWKWGMNDAGLVGDYTLIPESQLGESTKEVLNKETNKIMQNSLKEVETLLKNEQEIAKRFVKELMQKEELDYDEIDAIFKEYGKHQAPSPL